MTKVLVPLAQGCEELEAITITDLMVRANIDVVTAGLDSSPVTAARGTKIIPDSDINNLIDDEFDMVVLPGGLPGADHLRDSAVVQKIIKQHSANGKYIAAICAAPKALAHAGLLENKTATGFPGVLDALELKNTTVKKTALEIDGKVITSRGPGTAMDFTLQLIELLEGKDKRDSVEKGLVR